MACCAAAAFFLSQIVLAFETVRRRIFGVRAETQRNDAVAWTLGASVPERGSRPLRFGRARKLIVAALVAEALLVAGTATAWTAYGTPGGNTDERDLWSIAMDSICASGSAAEPRSRLNNSIEGRLK